MRYAPGCRRLQQEGERTTPKERMKQLSTYLGKSLPTIDFLAGEREVNGGEKEEGLERRNGRIKVFIGVKGG